jgi:hypothetical protein
MMAPDRYLGQDIVFLDAGENVIRGDFNSSIRGEIGRSEGVEEVFAGARGYE